MSACRVTVHGRHLRQSDGAPFEYCGRKIYGETGACKRHHLAEVREGLREVSDTELLREVRRRGLTPREIDSE